MQVMWRTALSLLLVGLPLSPAAAEQAPPTPPAAPAAPALPGKAPGLSVARDTVAAGVVDREPQDTAAVFAPTIHTVYYFTEVHGAEAPTTITHRWSYKDQVMAEVKLSVEGSPWRTWSSKTILPEWTGTWKVEALTEAGQVLTGKTFTIQ
ncbi:MAG: DUF2914 domain-containing protein [candidate division NC10 bacterium]|nr:DUF2914 domain-containing protein [candidate division NC10 bacterium]